MMLNPLHSLLLHNACCAGLSAGAWVLVRRRTPAALIGMAAGLGASLLWRHLSPDLSMGWRDFIY